MFQLLLVDDEDATLQGLASLPWKEIGISNVHCAYTANEAMSLLCSHAIDIVVTDIRMPGKSGVELLTDIKESEYNPKCLLLSGHSDFAYAQAAIKAQAVDYLLKPVRDEDLLRAVENALIKRGEEQSEKYVHERSIEAIKSHIDSFGEMIIEPWLWGRKTTEDLKAELKAYGMPYSLKTKAAFIFIRANEQVALNDIELIVSNYLSKYSIVVKHQMDEYLLTVMLYPLLEQEDNVFFETLQEQVAFLKKHVKKKLHIPISIKIGSLFPFWDQARDQFTTIKQNKAIPFDMEREGAPVATRVKNFVEAHSAKNPNLQDVAAYLYLNPAYVSKRFKEETGENFTEYMNRLRMKKAIALLTDTNKKISSISEELGFKDSSYFIKVFKREFNLTPQEFRCR
ncbi:response regulator transcription factor [Shouchella patagoniensis]|uniref:response regulator transcription factor n=1 Tax=Shouchella patagoniensis TaxID=228576 RepID=UPI0009954A6F|nr:response regulator [Shouchella patagoniensis]